MGRLGFYNSIFSARVLFVAGLLIAPALLFNPGTEYRVVQFVFFWFLAWLSGRKIDILFTLLIIAIIVVFNLIIPYGKVLFSIGMFKVTSGALEAGIHRAVTLQALVMLSKVTVRQDLKLPGVFGELLGESLRMFSVIGSRKYKITRKNFITDIDNLMLELSKEDQPQSSSANITTTKPAGYLIITVVIILSWLPWINIFL
ncbi:MAG: hypothetical protein FWD13_06045 [Treponema sp.]|nr:hypothetical protein [Treponema sp.]